MVPVRVCLRNHSHDILQAWKQPAPETVAISICGPGVNCSSQHSNYHLHHAIQSWRWAPIMLNWHPSKLQQFACFKWAFHAHNLLGRPKTAENEGPQDYTNKDRIAMKETQTQKSNRFLIQQGFMREIFFPIRKNPARILWNPRRHKSRTLYSRGEKNDAEKKNTSFLHEFFITEIKGKNTPPIKRIGLNTWVLPQKCSNMCANHNKTLLRSGCMLISRKL